MVHTRQDSPLPEKGRSVFIRTYGCQMNVHDSERMADLLRPLGYRQGASPEEADLVILNTCHIREKAAEKVYSELGRLDRIKRLRADRGLDMKIVVAGCVAQAQGREIIARAGTADMIVGPQSYHRLPEMLARLARKNGDVLETDFAVEEKFDTLPLRQADGPTAYITIQEGCDKFCTFCVVPYTRGPEVSRPVHAVIAEARALAAAGVREVTLLGQNVNAWSAQPPPGADSTGKQVWGLGELCRYMAKIDGLERIRFTTSHPRDMDDGLIAAIGEEKKLMPYLHLPVQSGSDTVLKAMNRGHSAEEYIELVGRIRRARPDIALSGDFIVGFPEETEDAFCDTLALVEAVEYAASYSFKYSRRPGTPAAGARRQVSEEEKTDRLARLQTLLARQQQAFNRRQVGNVLPVLFERPGRHAGQMTGRSPYLQSVHVCAPQSITGSIVPVYIESLTAHSLAGTLAAERDGKKDGGPGAGDGTGPGTGAETAACWNL